MASIAVEADVQPSTLVRFSQAMGYQGFSELQEVFRSRLRDRILNYEERIEQLRQHALSASKSHAIFQGFTEAAEKSINTLQERLEPKKLDHAVEISKQGRNHLPPRPPPLLSDLDLHVLCLRKAQCTECPDRRYRRAGPGGTGLCHQARRVLAISFTPYASETVALAQAAAARNVPIVAITDSGFSPLASLAETWFEVAEANFEGFRSMAATLSLAMTLTVAVAEMRGRRN